ncbi:MAG TPA: hypothetical protein VFE42_31750 [Chloroflexota bacterium]|nr:hypothetical protein [Chloroflexota bacterium]
MALEIDDRARRVLERCRPGQAVLITVVGNYGLPGEMLTVERCEAEQAAHDPDLTVLEAPLGVPIFIYRRIAAYARWHTLHLTARRLGWWTSLAIKSRDEVQHDLMHWEHTHPGLSAHVPAA